MDDGTIDDAIKIVRKIRLGRGELLNVYGRHYIDLTSIKAQILILDETIKQLKEHKNATSNKK